MKLSTAALIFFLVNVILFNSNRVACEDKEKEKDKENSDVAKPKDSGFKCHQCNSNTDKNCDDPFKSSEFLKPCENGETFCRKIVQKVEGIKSIVRQCAKELYKTNYVGCYKTAGKSTQNVCTCDEAGCNSAIGVKSSVLAIFLFAIIAALF